MKNKRARSIVFILVTCFVIPALFFVGFEFTLRFAGYGYETDFFVTERIKGVDYYVDNYKFSWQFFPKSMARLSASVKVPVHKDKSSLRIFVFGESAAMGDPEPSFSFSRQLEVKLRKKYADKKIEIYNTAITAINSNVILPMVKDCMKLEPDLLVLYIGNNEVIGPYGLSGALSPFFSNRWFIKFRIALGKTRVGQLFRCLIEKDEINEAEWGGMDLFTKNKVSYDNPDLQVIYSHYKSNIEEICKVASADGIRVVLSTVITNERDCAPFVSVHRAAMTSPELTQWQGYYSQAIGSDTVGNALTALDLYKKAFMLDSAYAELNFRLAKCLARLNQPDIAAKHFVIARDEDGLRFRCDSKMNEIIREIGRNNISKNVFFADAEAFARARSIDNVLGKELLYEHVHLNFTGNDFVSGVILEEVELALKLDKGLKEPDNIEGCNAALAYTLFDEKRIDDMNLARIQVPPFTNQYTNPQDVAVSQAELHMLEESLDSSSVIPFTKLYENALINSPNDYFIHLNFLRFLFNYKHFTKAAGEAAVLFELLPYEYLASINMGITQKALHHYSESQEYFARAIELNPYFSEAYKNMAVLYEESGEFYKAEPYLFKGRSSLRELGAAYNRVGIKFARQNNADSSIKYFKKATAVLPGYKPAELNLKHAMETKTRLVSFPGTREFSEAYNSGNALFRLGKFQQAIIFYRRAIKLNPSFPKTYNNLGIALIQVGKMDEAIDHFLAAVKIDPEFMDVYPNLAKSLVTRERLPEAAQVLENALRLRPDPDLYNMLAGIFLRTGKKASAQICFQKEQEIRSKRQP